ncbi:MAG: UDP-N-acetylglucosamine 2-epimerase (non-hydrolyzing), partial [Peptococcaceae bacterium]
MLKVLVVFGTRPEAIKMAPLVKELEKYPRQIRCKVAVTAQHREMLDQVLNLFSIVPDYDLNIMRHGQDLFTITGRVLAGMREILETDRPGLVLVHGDTSTTFVAALAAFYLQIPVGHVEAGLRTRHKYSPFPEELNRHLTGVLADRHFAPTGTALDNLLKEGVPRKNILVAGNTVIDALQATVKNHFVFADPVLSRINYDGRRVLLVTTHRRENLGAPLRSVYLALKEIVRAYDDVEIVFPVHKNPEVRRQVEEVLAGAPRVHLLEPLDYEPFVNVMQRSYLV